MKFSAKPVSVQEISTWRDLYRQEMSCQIVHDSMTHGKAGRSRTYLKWAVQRLATVPY
jgi:hypothetical protein